MAGLGTFMVGFASGWLVRSTIDSTRTGIVAILSACHVAVERTRFAVATEREYFADLAAEARSRYERIRAANEREPQSATQGRAATEASREERAA